MRKLRLSPNPTPPTPRTTPVPSHAGSLLFQPPSSPPVRLPPILVSSQSSSIPLWLPPILAPPTPPTSIYSPSSPLLYRLPPTQIPYDSGSPPPFAPSLLSFLPPLPAPPFPFPVPAPVFLYSSFLVFPFPPAPAPPSIPILSHRGTLPFQLLLPPLCAYFGLLVVPLPPFPVPSNVLWLPPIIAAPSTSASSLLFWLLPLRPFGFLPISFSYSGFLLFRILSNWLPVLFGPFPFQLNLLNIPIHAFTNCGTLPFWRPPFLVPFPSGSLCSGSFAFGLPPLCRLLPLLATESSTQSSTRVGTQSLTLIPRNFRFKICAGGPSSK